MYYNLQKIRLMKKLNKPISAMPKPVVKANVAGPAIRASVTPKSHPQVSTPKKASGCGCNRRARIGYNNHG